MQHDRLIFDRCGLTAGPFALSVAGPVKSDYAIALRDQLCQAVFKVLNVAGVAVKHNDRLLSRAALDEMKFCLLDLQVTIYQTRRVRRVGAAFGDVSAVAGVSG